jgi:hypothetical protein
MLNDSIRVLPRLDAHGMYMHNDKGNAMCRWAGPDGKRYV